MNKFRKAEPGVFMVESTAIGFDGIEGLKKIYVVSQYTAQAGFRRLSLNSKLLVAEFENPPRAYGVGFIDQPELLSLPAYVP